MSTTRTTVALSLVLGSCARVPTTNAPAPVIKKVLPTYGEIAKATECVRVVAEARLVAADLQLSGRNTASLPSLGEAWDEKHIDAEASFLPFDLRYGWDESVSLSIGLSTRYEPSMGEALKGVNFQIGSVGIGVVYGSVPLFEMVCLANLPFVTGIELPRNPVTTRIRAMGQLRVRLFKS